MTWKDRAEPVVVFLLALGIRLVYLDHTPLHDELYHVLSARSWLENGDFSIGDGSYTRASLFTLMVAGFFAVFGESLYIARLPSVIAGSLLVLVVYLWCRRVFGRAEALLASFFLALSPLAIHLSQYARFYAMQGLLLAMAAFLFYLLVAKQRLTIQQRIILALLVVVLLGVAVHLQIITLVGVGGMLLWYLGYALYRFFQAPRGLRRGWGAVLFALAGTGVMFVGALIAGLLDRYLDLLLYSPVWAPDGAENIRFYHYWLLEEYPAFWALFPVASLLALARYPGPASYCLVIFITAIAIHSISGFKALRYIGYIMPFFFIIWACAIVSVWGFLARHIDMVIAYEPPALRNLFSIRTQRLLAGSLIVSYVILSTPAFPLAYRMMTRPDADWPENAVYRGAADWPMAARLLHDRIRDRDLLLTTSGIMALYYLGRYDVEINASNLHEVGESAFSLDYRTGRPVLGSARSLRVLMSCYQSGVIVAEKRRLMNAPNLVPDDVLEVIESQGVRLSLPGETRMVAYRWENTVSDMKEKCVF